MTDKEVFENGQRLFQSADNLRQSARDLDALLESLWEAIGEKEFFGKIEDLGDEDAGVDRGWLTPAYAYNAAVLSFPKRLPGQKGPSKKPTKIGTLTFIVRLCNSGDIEESTADWPWLEQACLILGWHSQEHAEANWEIENFDPGDKNLAAIVHVGSGLWAWQENTKNSAYFFAVPLFVLRNEANLKQFALRPLEALFKANDPGEDVERVLRDIPVLLPSAG